MEDMGFNIATNNFNTGDSVLEIIYLLASAMFIVGLKMLSRPDTARRGNLIAAAGMSLAILATIILHRKDGEPIGNVGWIVAAIIAGTAIGWAIALRVKMTAMPQLVSFFNGMGGAAAAVISLIEFSEINHSAAESDGVAGGYVLAILLALVIGSVSFSGSMVAFGKLDGRINDIRAGWLSYVNTALLVVLAAFIVLIMNSSGTPATLTAFMYILFAISLIYGVLFVMPIGGADMPVVISLLNSFTGVAAAMGGFLYGNQVMLTGGILVGSAGTILTILMCRAMNRSLLNVIIGAFGGGTGATGYTECLAREAGISDAAIQLSYSRKVVIVPGYGLAVARAQHACHDLDKLLTEKGVEVKYAIHPVAGRMPGHMNVLLAEADVPYSKLVESDEINPQLPDTDVVIVVGANDVVNPAAEDDRSSPIFGMPIIKARDAKSIIVVKRGMGKGYAAIDNFLFCHPKTRMLFGDAKEILERLVSEVKSV